jgi:hypothetical protein
LDGTGVGWDRGWMGQRGYPIEVIVGNKKKIELMHHTHIINTGLKGIFRVIRGTYIKPLCAIQPLSHPTPLSPVMYQGKARKSMGEKNLVSRTVINFK